MRQVYRVWCLEGQKPKETPVASFRLWGKAGDLDVYHAITFDPKRLEQELDEDENEAVVIYDVLKELRP